ncbi:MAG: metal ABC transporter permease [Verrucomicrobiota bacterium]
MFTEAFMIRAFLAALFLCPLCALLGVFVTARRMSFFSETIAHGALTGVAIGIWMGMTELTVPVIGFGLLVAVAIIWLKENTELMTDTIMALLLAGSISLGIFILSLVQGGYVGQVHSYLFGDILAVENRDVVVAGILFAIVAAGVFLNLNVLALMSAHEDLAHVCGVNVRRANYLFVLALTITVAVSIQLLGIMLVTSLVVIPPAAARNVSCNLRQQIVYSLLIGVVGGIGGIALSYHYDAPCGATIAMSCIGLFLVSLVVRLFTRNRNANQPLTT